MGFKYKTEKHGISGICGIYRCHGDMCILPEYIEIARMNTLRYELEKREYEAKIHYTSILEASKEEGLAQILAGRNELGQAQLASGLTVQKEPIEFSIDELHALPYYTEASAHEVNEAYRNAMELLKAKKIPYDTFKAYIKALCQNQPNADLNMIIDAYKIKILSMEEFFMCPNVPAQYLNMDVISKGVKGEHPDLNPEDLHNRIHGVLAQAVSNTKMSSNEIMKILSVKIREHEKNLDELDGAYGLFDYDLINKLELQKARNEMLLKNAFANPRLDESSLELAIGLAEKDSITITHLASLNPNCRPLILEEIFEVCHNGKLATDEETLMNLARNKNTPKQYLNMMCEGRKQNPNVARLAKLNPSNSVKLISEGIQSLNEEVLEKINTINNPRSQHQAKVEARIFISKIKKNYKECIKAISKEDGALASVLNLL